MKLILSGDNNNAGGLIYATFLAIILLLASLFPGYAQDKESSKIKNLHEEILIINLLNNLDLREKQVELILGNAKLVKAIRDNLTDKINSRSEELANSYDSIKKELKTGKVLLSEQTTKKYIGKKDELKKLKMEADEKIDKIALNLETKLEPFQINALDNYKPCIIPRVAKGRIGQSDSDLGIVKLFERIREAPYERYIIKKDNFVNKLLERIKTRLPLGMKLNEAEVRSEIMTTCEKVRTINEVDFQINKGTIAEELREKILPNKIEMSRMDKIKKFLLAEEIIPILQERLNKL